MVTEEFAALHHENCNYLTCRKGGLGCKYLILLSTYWKGVSSRVGIDLLCQVTEQEETALSCARGVLDWLSGKNFSSESFVKHWNRLHREILESPPLERYKRHIDQTLRDMFYGGLGS